MDVEIMVIILYVISQMMILIALVTYWGKSGFIYLIDVVRVESGENLRRKSCLDYFALMNN